MDIGFVIYEGMTALDFVGIHDGLTRLKTMGFTESIDWEICAQQESVTATGGVTISASSVGTKLDRFDVVIVPGGADVSNVRDDPQFIDWLQGGAEAEYKVSVCTGALLLGEAGLLKGHRATTHPMAYEQLSEYCSVVDERVVDDGEVITARGVTSAIDLGLYLCERFEDAQTRQEISEQMDYPFYEPPEDLLSD